MNTQVVISSLAINKNSNITDFQKYNIEVSLEEIENRITSNKLRYGLTLLSNPKNVRISIEGTASISGTEQECIQALEKDENGIPRVLHFIYQDIFPTIFMNVKVVGAPCPAFRLAHISDTQIPEQSEAVPQPTAAPEQSEAVPQPTAAPEQSEAAPEQPAAPQPTAAPEQSEAVPQPTAAPEQPAAPQPTAAPEQSEAAPQPTAAPEQPASMEKKPEEMSLQELNQLYTKLGNEYQNNPSGDVGVKLQNVTNLIQKRQQEQMVTESSM